MVIAERFAAKCGKPDERGCIIWLGAVNPNGYGAFKMGGKAIGAHVAAMRLSGVIIPKRVDVCHACDVKLCVNVAHLFVGTRSDNMNDAKDKGRLLHPYHLTASPLDTMSDEEVVEELLRYGSVAKAFAILKTSQSLLSRRLRKIGYEIKGRGRGRTWVKVRA